MTVSAHGTRRVYNGATRTRDPETSSVPMAGFFNELNPHLKHVRATTLTRVQALHVYLSHRPGRTVAQIQETKMTNYTRNAISDLLTGNPSLFQRTGRAWYAIPQVELVAHPRAAGSTELANAINEYLTAHGPSTVREITDGLGHHDIRYVSAVIGKPPCKAVRMGKRRNCQVWGIETGGYCAVCVRCRAD